MSTETYSNASKPVLLSGFADEAANQKTAEQQFCAFAALGLRYYTLRFIDAGAGIQNAMLLAPESIDRILDLQAEYGLRVSSLGSPIGKVKLIDVEDGTSNRYVPFQEYLKKDVQRACDLANTFGCKLIRGFSFYHPRGTDPEVHLSQAIDQLGKIARLCDSHGLTFGLEVEANLIGQTGKLLKKLYDGVADPAMMLIFDGANLVCQGMSTEQVYQEYMAMKEGMGWLHVKDYQRPTTRSTQSCPTQRSTSSTSAPPMISTLSRPWRRREPASMCSAKSRWHCRSTRRTRWSQHVRRPAL